MMPKIGQPIRKREPLATTRQPWEEFLDDAAWLRSHRGNLWRIWDGLTLTIFRRGAGFRWSMASFEGPTFSCRTYFTEIDAMIDLGHELGVGSDDGC
ncbi:MAG: hypothetical protein SH850_05435 [Planctomycetaceae bacterium]|nr:hypothetical protein [Planctomycetaceae bacterium]